MKSYKIPKRAKTCIGTAQKQEGEFIEMKVRRLEDNNEAIKDGKQMIYTAREDGVIGATDIRFDRFDAALDVAERAEQNEVARRQEKYGKKTPRNEGEGEAKNDGQQPSGTESPDGTHS